MEETKTSSSFSTWLNLINNIVGAGLFSMPWCLKEASVITGCLFLMLVAVLNSCSFLILAECCELSQKFTYLEMGRVAYGHTFGNVVQFFVMLYATGSCISYVVLTGDLLIGHDTGVFHQWFDHTILYGEPESRFFVLSMIALVIFLPLGCFRQLGPLSYTSFVSFIATLYAAFLCFYALAFKPPNALTPAEIADPDRLHHINWIGFPTGVFAAIPIFNVAFTAHYNCPRYYCELADRSIPRFRRVVFGALGFSAVVYMFTAVCGYLLFGGMTLGDVLKNFNSSLEVALIARVALSLVVIFTFPLAHHCVRDSLIGFVFSGRYTSDTVPLKYYMPMTIMIITLTTVVGILCTQVEVVLAYKGALFGSGIVYVFPSLMYLQLRHVGRGGDPLVHEPLLVNFQNKETVVQFSTIRENFQSRKALPYFFLFTWGVVTGTLGVIISALNQAHVLTND